MSVESISKALKVRGLSSTEKLVLIGIANHDGDGGAWPSIHTLSLYADCSDRTVQRAISMLETHGYVTVVDQAGGTADTRADRRPNRYLLHLDGVTPATPRGERGDTGDVNGVTSTVERGDTALSPEPSLEPSIEPSITVDPFDAFWANYPRKVGKPAARRAFKGAIAKSSIIEILNGLGQWIVYWKASKTAEGYIPHPQTWLNQERWNDRPPKVKESGSMNTLRRLAGGELG